MNPLSHSMPGSGRRRDSLATITVIGYVDGATLRVGLTFTSHQQPSDSATGTACTSWQIDLFLQSYSVSYLMVAAPPGYHARFEPC